MSETILDTVGLTVKPNALIVDDQRSYRHQIATVLRQGGFSITTAPDGSFAMQLLRQSDFDVIVTDLQMPNEAGEQLIENVRRSMDAHIRSLPIIVVSSVTDMVTRAELRSLGVNGFHAKPIVAGVLLEVVEAARLTR